MQKQGRNYKNHTLSQTHGREGIRNKGNPKGLCHRPLSVSKAFKVRFFLAY
jgi:hypothetical protein